MLTFAGYLLVFMVGGALGAFAVGVFAAADDNGDWQ